MTAAAALAASDTDDSLSPANTSFTVSNSGNITFTGTIDGLGVTVTCTNVTLTAKTRASGLTADVTSSPPVDFHSSCTDSFGGHDTVTTSGTWTLTLVDSPTESQREPNSGDQLTINVPSGGATFTSSALPGCTITAGASTPTGPYNDKTTATYTNAAMNVTASGCTTSPTTSLSGTFVSNKKIGDLTT
jgi:hypothetical protein